MTQKQLIRNLNMITDDFQCCVCNCKESVTWYRCSNSHCDKVYCSKELCDTMASMQHQNMGENGHRYNKVIYNLSLTLPDQDINTNANEMIDNKEKIITMGKSESYRGVKDFLSLSVYTAMNVLTEDGITKGSSAFAKFLIKSSKKLSGGSALYIQGAVGAIDIGITCYRYFYSGDIKSGSECLKEITQKVSKHILTFSIVYGSTKVCMGLGWTFGGPIGALIGGCIGFLASKGIDYVYEKYLPKNDEKNQYTKKIINDALIVFQYDPNDIYNHEIFNVATLRSRYRNLARDCHPNSINGRKDPRANQKFLILSQRLGVLEGLATRLNNKKATLKEHNQFCKQMRAILE